MLQQTSKLKKSKRERCEQSWSKYLAAAQCGLCSKGSCLLSGQKSLVLQVLRKEGEATPGDQRVRVSDQSDQVLCLKLKSQATTVVSIFDLGSRFCNLYLRSVPVHPSYWLRHRIILTWGSSHKGGVEKKWNKFKAFSIRRRQKDKVKGFRYRVWLKSSIVGFLDCIGQTDPNEPNSSTLVDPVTRYLEKTN